MRLPAADQAELVLINPAPHFFIAIILRSEQLFPHSSPTTTA